MSDLVERASPLVASVLALEARLRADEKRMETLRELHRALGATLDLDELVPLLLDKLAALLDAEAATLYLVDEDRTTLSSAVALGDRATRVRLRVGEGIAGWVAATGQTVMLDDAYRDKRFQPDFDRRTGFRTRSVLCLPVRSGRDNHVVGVAQILNRRGRPFDADDAALLSAVAGHIGIAVENAQLHRNVLERNAQLVTAEEELRGKVEDMNLLLEIEREVSASTNLDDLLDRLVRRATELLHAEAGALLLRDPATGSLELRTLAGGAAELHRLGATDAPEGIIGWVYTHREPVAVDDPAADPRCDRALARRLGVEPHNLAAVPLVHLDASADEAVALGTLAVLNRVGQDAFDAADLTLLQLIASHVSRAVAVGRARDERRKQERLAAIGQLLSGVLHDLRSPLTVVAGYVDLMASAPDEKTRNDYAATVHKQLELLAAMTREVLEFARGESKLLVRKVYVNELVDDIARQLAPELLRRNIELAVDKKYAGVAWFDELKLRRVIHNIARNAMEAMPEGGTFTLTTEERGADLVFTFVDTGAGIPAEVEGRLFELFATAGKQGGTGLGLAMVKKIVDEHGGKVTYRSTPRGTTFEVAIPMKPSGALDA